MIASHRKCHLTIPALIEVKGISGAWGDKGVGLTAPEFHMAITSGDQYWLYVVEFAGTDARHIIRIQDPATKANEYLFDDGWRAVSS